MRCPGPEVPCWIFDKMHKFSRSFAVYHVALAFLCCHHIDSYITYMTISFNTVNAYVYSHIFNESRWSLEHKHFLRGIHSPTLLLGGGAGACIPPPSPRPISSVGGCFAAFSANYVYSQNHVWKGMIDFRS